MATTTNFGWETPDDTDLVKDGAAAIRTALGGVDTSFVDLKGGTTGQVLSKASNTDLDFVWANDASGTTEINPNLIINGNFTINQRSYVSAANLASGSYGFDRWKSSYTNTSLTFTSAPAGQTVTISTSGVITQIVEQANVPAGTYTLSWTGTATGRIYNSGGSAPSYAASPVSFTADGLANVVVEFTASGSTKTLGKVKLELGSTATAYSYAGGTIQGELSAAQRYYYRVSDASSTYWRYGQGNGESTTVAQIQFQCPTTMRVRPTAMEYSNFGLVDGSAAYTGGTWAINTNRSTSTSVTADYTHGSAALTQKQSYGGISAGTASSYIAFTAEL